MIIEVQFQSPDEVRKSPECITQQRSINSVMNAT
jgi:hypothetical protein